MKRGDKRCLLCTMKRKAAYGNGYYLHCDSSDSIGRRHQWTEVHPQQRKQVPNHTMLGSRTSHWASDWRAEW